jgi:hypothetical protein
LSQIKTNAKNDAKANVRTTVRALLCWSEYYNGKWQATKTSSISEPAELGQYHETGSGAFRRSDISLYAREEDGALRVTILDTYQSFLLYNTHGLPEVNAEWPEVLPSVQKSRTLYVSESVSNANLFSISYWTGDEHSFSRDILDSRLPFEEIEPLHYLSDYWTAPFFYQDRRHVFYVTSSAQLVRLDLYPDYGLTLDPGPMQVAKIPPLVVKVDPRLEGMPPIWGGGDPIRPKVNPIVVNTAPITRFVTEDIYIQRGLGTPGDITYGDKQIGPSGMIEGVGAQF